MPSYRYRDISNLAPVYANSEARIAYKLSKLSVFYAELSFICRDGLCWLCRLAMGKKFNRAVIAECRGRLVGEVMVARPVAQRANGTPFKSAGAGLGQTSYGMPSTQVAHSVLSSPQIRASPESGGRNICEATCLLAGRDILFVFRLRLDNLLQEFRRIIGVYFIKLPKAGP
jgi:hypothetical protein